MPSNPDAEKNNPCLREQHLSYKCLSDAAYDKEKCSHYFDNYNSCKAFWNRIKGERRVAGITPHLPVPSERAKIKEEYMKKYPKTPVP